MISACDFHDPLKYVEINKYIYIYILGMNQVFLWFSFLGINLNPNLTKL